MRSAAPIRKAIVIAAGRGTRLGALTADRPKPMIPVAGMPALERILSGLVSAELSEFLFVVGYRREAITSHFGDGSTWNVPIAYVDQPVPNGTGAALALSRDFAGGDPILMSYGDILTDPAHYRALMDDYEAAPCAAVLGINPVDDPAAGAAVYRIVNRVTSVIEKPAPGTSRSRWNLSGVNVFSPVVFDVLERLAPSPRGEFELTAAITHLIAAGKEVRAVEFGGFWSDIGSTEELARAERTLTPK